MGPFYIMESIFPIFFVFFIGLMGFIVFRGIREWHNNNQQPILDVSAKIVSKRAHISRRGHQHSHTSTTYYVTFQVESGDRMELHVSAREYGLLAEGDQGKLTFQGTRYHRFERENNI